MMWHDVLTLLSGLGVALVAAVLLSADLRAWPPRPPRARQLTYTLLAGLTGVTLMLYPLPLSSGIFVDLRYLPTVLLTLLFGPGWGTLALLPVLIVRAVWGGAGVGPAIISALAALLIAGVIHRRVGLRLFTQPRLWTLLPLIFVFNGVGLLLQPGGAPLFQRVYGPLMLVNVLALSAVLLVVHLRARHLESLLDLRRAAFTDALTGLNNRRQFDLDLAELDAGQHLVALDVDFFKQVNDRLGHAAGDRVLREVAQVLLRSVRPQDSVYRVGGEEFALILRGLTSEQGLMVTQRCLSAAQQIDGGGQPVTLSAGWTLTQPDEPGETTLARADAALYRAKAAGRNRVEIDPGTDQMQAVTLAARRTLALLARDHDPDAADWLALLQAAVQDVPGAQSGTLYVLDRGDFLLCAQTGFSDDLLGQRRSPAGLLRWYAGPPGDWQAGAPRVLRGEAVRVNTHAASEVEAQVTGQESFRHLSVDGIHETLGVPVAVDGLVMAFLNLDRVAPGPPFGPDAQRTARTFTEQVAALLRARARRVLAARQQRELEALARLSGTLRGALSTEQVIAAVTGTSRALLGAREIVFLQYDPRGDRLVSRHLLGVSETEGRVTLPRGQGLAWAALEGRETLRVVDVRGTSRIHRPAFLTGGAMMAAPLHLRGQPLGVVCFTRDEPFGAEDADLIDILTPHVLSALERARERAELQDAQTGALLTLGLSLETRGLERPGHTRRVMALATRLARTLNLDEPARRALLHGAALHDIGLTVGPHATHPQAGETLARQVGGLHPDTLAVIRHHHERWDGQGFPDGLSAEQIPLLARAFALIDTLDTLSDPPGAAAPPSPDEVHRRVQRQAGAQLDPAMTALLPDLLDLPLSLPGAAPSGDAGSGLSG
ncbi:diguanylate cyclase domain-containing protein [Deinococcus knuensis]|uniref:Diguanylate cyclase n=1 Tax=Deinococcus knuensis TaxID=1837380 RepID=A0ABQ2SKM2_9DEIO|nr:diguanylate cyclase [Deinococcus knuensis]GGS28623.1 hypothetical protein GCM10008961_20350 [Deinococcus knuensis]